VSEIKRKELKLQGASEVSRLHAEQLKPPEMMKLRNAIAPRSDLVPGMRPDLRTSSWLNQTRASDWQGEYATEADFYNRSVWSLNNRGEVVFSRMWPFRRSGGSYHELAPTYTTGTVSTDHAHDRRYLTGTDTAWAQEIWPGCWFGFGDGSGDLYLIRKVYSDTVLKLDADPGAQSGESYTIYKTWHPDQGLWPVKTERFGTYVVAAPVKPVAPIDPNNVCGPFYSDIEASDLGESKWYEQFPAEGEGVHYLGVATQSSINVVVGSNATILRSTGFYTLNSKKYLTWNKETIAGTSSFYGVDAGDATPSGGYFVAVGAGGQVFTADDTATPWTSRTSGTAESLMAVVVVTGNSGVAIAVGHNGTIIVSIDNGETWSALASGTSENLHGIASAPGATYDYIVIVGDNGTILTADSSGIGSPSDWQSLSFTARTSGTARNLAGVYGDGRALITYAGWWMVTGGSGKVLVSEDNGATWEDKSAASGTGTYLTACTGRYSVGTWYLGGGGGLLQRANPTGQSYHDEETPIDKQIYGLGTIVVDSANYMMAACSYGWVMYSSGASYIEFNDFIEISDTYRAQAFCRAGGFMVYGGMSEYDSGWEFHAKRIRWASPGSVADFSTEGHGFADIPVVGQILDLCASGNAIIVGSSGQISTLTPGISSTWKHRELAEGLWQLSNMVAVNEVVYFVGSDGLLYAATTAGVRRVESGFDLSVADDWEVASSSPIGITYSPSMQTLLILRVADPYRLHLVEPEGGQHVVWDLPEVTSGGVTYTPAMISTTRTPTEDRLIVSYGEVDTKTELMTLDLAFDGSIYGNDEIDVAEGTADGGRWNLVMETGLLRFGGVGDTVDIKDIEIHTFCWDDSEVDELGGTPPSLVGPDVLVEVRSNEDSSWRSLAESGAVEVETSSCSGTDTTFNHKIGEGTAGGQTVYSTPCRAAKAVVFTETGGTYTEVTAFTVSGTYEITCTVAPTDGHGVYAFWSGEPVVSTVDSDYVRTTAGLHRITSVSDYKTLVLEWYPSETLDGTIVKAQQAESGSGILTFGVGASVEELALRVSVAARGRSLTDVDVYSAAVVRIKRIIVSYVPTDEEQKTDE
jgi:photosystem II stability/assembly factor-like uncharacterized protein